MTSQRERRSIEKRKRESWRNRYSAVTRGPGKKMKYKSPAPTMDSRTDLFLPSLGCSSGLLGTTQSSRATCLCDHDRQTDMHRHPGLLYVDRVLSWCLILRRPRGGGAGWWILPFLARNRLATLSTDLRTNSIRMTKRQPRYDRARQARRPGYYGCEAYWVAPGLRPHV